MVKPDAKHDYYADLELPQTADAEEIKRQFRQLGEQDSRSCIDDANEPQLSNIIPIVILGEKSM